MFKTGDKVKTMIMFNSWFTNVFLYTFYNYLHILSPYKPQILKTISDLPLTQNSSAGQIMFSVEQTTQFSSFMEEVLSFQFSV